MCTLIFVFRYVIVCVGVCLSGVFNIKSSCKFDNVKKFKICKSYQKRARINS